MATVTIKVRDCRKGQVMIAYRSEKGLSREAKSGAEQVATAMLATGHAVLAKGEEALEAACKAVVAGKLP